MLQLLDRIATCYMEDFPEDPQHAAFLFHEAPFPVPRTMAVTVDSPVIPPIVVEVQEALEPSKDGKSSPYLILIHGLYFLNLETPVEGGRPRQKQKATQAVVDMMDNRVCADEGCEKEIPDNDLLHCDACKLAVCSMDSFS